MDVFRTMDVVGSALTAERTRLNAIASNLANANSAKRADGEGPYRRQDVMLEAVPMEAEFTEVLDKVQHPYTEVRVTEVKEDESEPLLVHKPEHPLANAEGYVAMPNVNPVTETANMISAERAYQNNVNVFQTTKQMALKALEIGR
jgi:flagellar basal-body rod protein FlgC